MDMIKSLIGPINPLNQNALKDTAKLVILGSTMEATRRVSASAWSSFVDSFFLTAHFSQEDYPYDWLMHWLSKQPAWSRSREFEITTQSSSKMNSNSVTDDLDEDEEDDGTTLVHGRKKRKVAFLPSLDVTHSIFYRGHWLRITRSKRVSAYGSCQEIKISVVARNNNVLKKLVMQAKREYETDMEHRVHIFLADSYGSWRWNGARQKRPLSSIVLEPGVKDMLIADSKDFLNSEEWYAERGIPFRRGYLLHGVPGSGKTSLIHAIAGELGLDIYVVSLSGKGMNDTTLTNLMGRVPSRCILLLEDLDAAFTRSTNRDEKSTGAPVTPTVPAATPADDPNTLSLSGLLNSLDGVAAAEGRLLFATTNHIERLDPALSRPGRMDVWVDFKHASKWQAEGIFKNFFPCKPTGEALVAAEAKAAEETAKAAASPPHRRRAYKHAVPLLDEAELAELAKEFAAAIPEDEMSVAGLQGYLLRNKTRPREAVKEVAAWIQKERETKAKLKKEKEEKEAKEKKEKEEKEYKEKKEQQEKEAKEKEEKLAAALKEQEEKDAIERRRLRRIKSKKTVKPEPVESESEDENMPAPVAAPSTPPPAPTPAVTPTVAVDAPAVTAATAVLDEKTTTTEAASLTESSPTTSEESSTSTDASDSDSATSEAETEKSVDPEAPVEVTVDGKQKWVAVKGPSDPSSEAVAATTEATIVATEVSETTSTTA